MIVAKTNMKKIPDSCNKCKLSYTESLKDWPNQTFYFRVCSITGKNVLCKKQKIVTINIFPQNGAHFWRFNLCKIINGYQN